MIRESGILEGPLPPELHSPTRLLCAEHGAITSFLGVVRNEHLGKGVTKLDYSCYHEMAEVMLPKLITQAAEEHDAQLSAIVYHGLGVMTPGEVSLCIHVSCAHRVAAFAACRQLLETIKADLPVWKQEYYADGSDAWLKGS